MRTESVIQYLQGSLRGLGLSVYLPGGDDFAGKLNIGDVIKGRALRHLEGSKYLVNFNGQEKVVDSAIPLKTSEILYGRVIALGDKVELQRIGRERSAGTGEAATESAQVDDRLFAGKYEQLLNQVFGKYQGKLSIEGQNALLRLVRTAADPTTMILAGLVLGKMGLPQTADLLRALYDAIMASDRQQRMFPTRQMPASHDAGDGEKARGSLDALAAEISRLIEEIPEKRLFADTSAADDVAAGSGGANGDAHHDESPEQLDLARWLLNAQVDGSVAHRVGTIPLWIGSKLIEIDIAMFDQRRQVESPQGLRHRKIAFSLDLDHLGRVDIQASIAGENVRLNFQSDRERSTAALANSMDELRNQLAKTRLNIDELRYETRFVGDGTGVARTVVEHIVSQDSLSRLM